MRGRAQTKNDRILESARHVSPDMSRVRQVQPGMTYLPPPSQDKLNPETLTAEALLARLRDRAPGRFDRALADCITAVKNMFYYSAKIIDLDYYRYLFDRAIG